MRNFIKRLLSEEVEQATQPATEAAGTTEEKKQMTSQEADSVGEPEKVESAPAPGTPADGNSATPEIAADGKTEAEEVTASGDVDAAADIDHERDVLFGTDPLQTAPLEPLPEEPHALPLAKKGQAPSRTANARPSYMRAAGGTHLGHVRTRNEDACLIFVAHSGGFDPVPPFGLFIVADGMGGHLDGHIASQIVARTMSEHVLRTLYLPLLRGDESLSRRPIQEVMEEAAHLANKALYLPDPEKEMGTTLTAALILGSRLFVVHVGDSRAYLLQEESLSPVTTDHSVVQALQDAGQLTAEEAAVHPNRNLLYRTMIGEELEQVDAFSHSLPRQGMLMLCSDGLWGLLTDAEMKSVLQGESSLQEKADKLIAKALAAGGHDNITVILVDFLL